MKRLVLVMALFISLFASAEEYVLQETQVDLTTGAFGVAIVPQYAIMGGMRIDFDVKLKSNQYLTLAPQYYYSNNSNLYPPSPSEFAGGGMKINYRFFPGVSNVPKGGYVGFSVDYKYMDISYDRTLESFYTYMEDGIEKMSSSGNAQTKRQIFNQGGFDMFVGYQPIISSNFFLDFYVGWGFRLSDYNQDTNPSVWNWGQRILDPGYTGFVPMGGIRIGIMLK